MKVEFLGTGGYHPNDRRHTACIMLADIGLIFDAGTSAFRIASRIKTKELDIYLTHSHLDHIVGLTFLLPPILLNEVDKVRVHGNQRSINAVKDHLFAEEVFPVDPPFEFVELTDASEMIDGVSIKSLPLNSHPGTSVAYRLDWYDKLVGMKSLGYVTDTTVDGSYDEFIDGVDVLIHECYFADDNQEWAEKTGHSYATAVAELAARTNVGQLVLTHIDPLNPSDDPVELDGMREIFAETILAEDEMVLKI